MKNSNWGITSNQINLGLKIRNKLKIKQDRNNNIFIYGCNNLLTPLGKSNLSLSNGSSNTVQIINPLNKHLKCSRMLNVKQTYKTVINPFEKIDYIFLNDESHNLKELFSNYLFNESKIHFVNPKVLKEKKFKINNPSSGIPERNKLYQFLCDFSEERKPDELEQNKHIVNKIIIKTIDRLKPKGASKSNLISKFKESPSNIVNFWNFIPKTNSFVENLETVNEEIKLPKKSNSIFFNNNKPGNSEYEINHFLNENRTKKRSQSLVPKGNYTIGKNFFKYDSLDYLGKNQENKFRSLEKIILQIQEIQSSYTPKRFK